MAMKCSKNLAGNLKRDPEGTLPRQGQEKGLCRAMKEGLQYLGVSNLNQLVLLSAIPMGALNLGIGAASPRATAK